MKQYMIDLESFFVEAENADEAYKIARELLDRGEARIDQILLEEGV